MSAERALLIRTAVNAENGRYFAVGMDFPSVRVFDTATGQIVSLVEPSERRGQPLSVLRSSGSLSGTAFAVSLASVTMGAAGSKAAGADVVLAAGLSDGTLLLHNVTRDEPVGHVVVSPSQQAVLSTAVVDGIVVALVRSGKVFVVDIDTGRVLSNALEVPKTATTIAAVKVAGRVTILVGGPTCTLYRLTSTNGLYVLERQCQFAAQATPMNFSWLSADATAAVTCGAQEGIVRVWDLTVDGRATCKRTLPAGHRVGHMRVCISPSEIGKAHVLVCVTTFLGQVLVWDLGTALIPKVNDPAPLEPSAVFVSSTPAGKLLVGDIIPSTMQLMTIRGRFALPRFEGRDILQLLKSPAARADNVHPLPMLASGIESTATTSTMDIDNEWASHHAVATRAITAPSEDFAVPKAFHAASVAQLPSTGMTIEQQQQQDERSEQQSKLRKGLVGGVSLGTVTLPLYQALHAGDKGLVMELLSVSSRTDSEIKNCVLALQMPYLLQLLRILSERALTSNCRAPTFRWVSAILQLRGAAMYAEQQAVRAAGGVTDSAKPSEERGDVAKVFVAPLLAQYRNTTALYDKLAVAYGRLSIFRSVNPIEPTVKRNLIHTETAVVDGILFPRAFRLVERNNGEPKVLRIRGKLERQAVDARRKRIKKARRDAALSEDEASVSEDDQASDISLNSDEMNAMLDGEEGMLGLDGPKKAKRDRVSKRGIIADGGELSGSGDDDRLSQDEDFDEASDDLIDSDEEMEDDEDDIDSSAYEESDEEQSDDGGNGDESDSASGSDDNAADDDEDNGTGEIIAKKGVNERRVRTD